MADCLFNRLPHQTGHEVLEFRGWYILNPYVVRAIVVAQ